MQERKGNLFIELANITTLIQYKKILEQQDKFEISFESYHMQWRGLFPVINLWNSLMGGNIEKDPLREMVRIYGQCENIKVLRGNLELVHDIVILCTTTMGYRARLESLVYKLGLLRAELKELKNERPLYEFGLAMLEKGEGSNEHRQAIEDMGFNKKMIERFKTPNSPVNNDEKLFGPFSIFDHPKATEVPRPFELTTQIITSETANPALPSSAPKTQGVGRGKVYRAII